MPLASTRTIASSAAPSLGSGHSSTRTSPGAWNVTACMGRRPFGWPGSPALPDRLALLREGARSLAQVFALEEPGRRRIADGHRLGERPAEAVVGALLGGL